MSQSPNHIEEILADFESNFPTRDQVINDKKGTWDFTEYFKEKFIAAFTHLSETVRAEEQKRIELEIKPTYDTRVGEVQEFADMIKEDPVKIINWARKEIAAYQELIDILEKRL